jgi:hypothetical protein
LHDLTRFVRKASARVRWHLRMISALVGAAFAMTPIRGADGEGGGEADPPPAGGGEGGDDRKFTQVDVDRIVQDRLARDRRDRPSDEEIESLREKARKQDEAEQANASELDKEKQRADNAEQKAQEATERANEAFRKAAIVAAATGEKAVDPAAVHALLKDRGFKFESNGNELQVTVGDDGQVTGAEEVVKAFLSADSNKYLVGTTPSPGPGDGGARHAQPVPDPTLDDQIAEAEKEGDWQTVNRLNAQKLGQVKSKE